MPLPSDHLRLLVELLRPAGAELGRRWLAALLVVPAESRERVVAAVEARIVGEFGHASGRTGGGEAGGGEGGAAGATGEGSGGPVRRVGPKRPPSLYTAVSPPAQRDGFVERVETTYEIMGEPTEAPATKARRKKKSGA